MRSYCINVGQFVSIRILLGLVRRYLSSLQLQYELFRNILFDGKLQKITSRNVGRQLCWIAETTLLIVVWVHMIAYKIIWE